MKTIIDVMPITDYYYCDWHVDGTWFINHCYEQTEISCEVKILHSNMFTEDNYTNFYLNSSVPETSIVIKLNSEDLSEYPELFI